MPKFTVFDLYIVLEFQLERARSSASQREVARGGGVGGAARSARTILNVPYVNSFMYFLSPTVCSCLNRCARLFRQPVRHPLVVAWYLRPRGAAANFSLSTRDSGEPLDHLSQIVPIRLLYSVSLVATINGEEYEVSGGRSPLRCTW